MMQIMWPELLGKQRNIFEERAANEVDKYTWKCPDCGYVLYCNVAAAVGVIISDKNNNVLFEIRAKEPRKGFAALPGGFIDADETAEDAAKRECCEEIGADVQNIKYVCSFPP